MTFVLTIGTFEPGEIFIARGAGTELNREDVLRGLRCHLAGDWGDLGEDDWKANDDALREGSRLFSKYRYGDGKSFYIITESDRSATTIMLPEEY